MHDIAYHDHHRYKLPRSNAKARSIGMDMTRMPRIGDGCGIQNSLTSGNVESAVVIPDQISAAGDQRL